MNIIKWKTSMNCINERYQTWRVSNEKLQWTASMKDIKYEYNQIELHQWRLSMRVIKYEYNQMKIINEIYQIWI